MGNPFYDDVDDTFRGVRVRVHTDDHTRGWCGRWHYNEHGVLVYEAEREDAEEFGAITINEPETVERLESIDPNQGGPRCGHRSIAVHPALDGRHRSWKVHQETRERGHLLLYPTVRSVPDGEQVHGHAREYEVVVVERGDGVA